MKMSKLTVAGLGVAIAAGCLATATASALVQSQSNESRQTAATVEGKIQALMIDRNEFTLEVKQDTLEQGSKRLTIKIDDKTAYTLDGTTSTRDAALKVGSHAKVAHEEMLASRIDVKSNSKPS